MAFQPTVLSPTPDPFFVCELQKIDPALRVTWGYERYLVNEWAIERKLSPEQYHRQYRSLLKSGSPRFVEQPILDEDEKQIGVRRYDLAPEYMWVSFAKVLDQRVLTGLKREYAWNQNHPISRALIESQIEAAAKEKELKTRRIDAAMDELPRVDVETGRRKTFS
jgi:hypothetical protein